MTALPKPPKKRTQYGRRKYQSRTTLAEQQRKVAAYLNMLQIASEKK
jgi:hypothetical protein